MPMSLPLDASLPEAQIKHARQALARAKAVGEEYTGVHVATATVRTRRAGYAIVDEARRRGVEAIVLGAEEPSLIRGGARPGRPRRAAGELRGGRHQVRDRQGHLPGDRDGAGGRLRGGALHGRRAAGEQLDGPQRAEAPIV